MSTAITARFIPPRPRHGSVRAGLRPLAVPAGSLPAVKAPGRVARARRRLSRTARAGVFTLLTMLAVVLGTPMSTASAAPFGLDCIGVPGKGNWGPEAYASASTVLLPAAQPQYGPEPKADMSKTTLAKNYTLYELTNGRGLLWSTYKKDADGDEKCSIMDVAGNWMAQTVFEFSKSLGSFSLGIQDLAMNSAPFQDLYQGKDGQVNSLVAKLYATLWAPLGVVMIVLCGAWVVIHSKDKSRTKVWQGVAGMVVSLFVSALLLQGSWYTTLTSEADKSINGLTSAMTEVMLPENAGNKTADPCWLPEGAPNRAKRISSCTMYKAMLFTPWAAGQFGANANTIIDSGWKGDAEGGWDTDDCSLGYRCTDIRTAQVMAQTYTRGDSLKSLDKKGDMFENVAKQMAKDDRRSRFNDWRGANPSSRMQVALASGVSNLVLAPAIDVGALFKLFWEGFILVLIIMLPIVGAVSAFPPATFMMREWANGFTIAFILKLIAWIGLTLLMVLYIMILSSTASLGVQILMLILIAFGLFHFVRKTMRGAKRAADQTFEAKAAYEDVTGRAGNYAKSQAQQVARRGFQQLTGNRMPSPRGSGRPGGPKAPRTRGPQGPSKPGGPTSNKRGADKAASSQKPTPVSGDQKSTPVSGDKERVPSGTGKQGATTAPRPGDPGGKTLKGDPRGGPGEGGRAPAPVVPERRGGGAVPAEGPGAVPVGRAASPRPRVTPPAAAAPGAEDSSAPAPVTRHRAASAPGEAPPAPRSRPSSPPPEAVELPRRPSSPRPPAPPSDSGR
ncbi:hypothetical protein [Streptomyces goshikiensis]|uniref:hypothetical protein n=1 Tax=Streptomyces goshikiensis TaxID=1942 RepID=UPI003681F5DE